MDKENEFEDVKLEKNSILSESISQVLRDLLRGNSIGIIIFKSHSGADILKYTCFDSDKYYADLKYGWYVRPAPENKEFIEISTRQSKLHTDLHRFAAKSVMLYGVTGSKNNELVIVLSNFNL